MKAHFIATIAASGALNDMRDNCYQMQLDGKASQMPKVTYYSTTSGSLYVMLAQFPHVAFMRVNILSLNSELGTLESQYEIELPSEIRNGGAMATIRYFFDWVEAHINGRVKID